MSKEDKTTEEVADFLENQLSPDGLILQMQADPANCGIYSNIVLQINKVYPGDQKWPVLSGVNAVHHPVCKGQAPACKMGKFDDYA